MIKISSFVAMMVLSLGLLTGCAISPSVKNASPTPVVALETAAPTDPAGDGQLTVTLDNQGQTITLAVGQDFLLKLGENYTWDVVVSDQNVVSRVPNIMVVRGAQGIYHAKTAGTATITATGDPLCRQAQPACAMPSIQFAITIVVKG